MQPRKERLDRDNTDAGICGGGFVQTARAVRALRGVRVACTRIPAVHVPVVSPTYLYVHPPI